MPIAHKSAKRKPMIPANRVKISDIGKTNTTAAIMSAFLIDVVLYDSQRGHCLFMLLEILAQTLGVVQHRCPPPR